MLNFGQIPDDPTMAWLRSRNPEVNDFDGRWSDQLSRAKHHLHVVQHRQKQYADHHRHDAPDYKVGDEVLLHFKLHTGVCKKLAPRLGPFKVVRPIRK